MHTSFHASVDQRLLDKVTRLFNSTLDDVFAELLQNARRAGAARVDVLEDGDDIVVRDDGVGITDPRVLLTLGESRWSEETQATEDPAGAGVFALSPRGATIRSRPKGADKGWIMTLKPAQFSGKEAVTANPCDMAPGTEITFPRRDGELVKNTLERAALHYPLPVSLNGQALDKKNFLEGGLFVIKDSGIEPAELADILQAAYFSPSDDACDDSYTTQQERFQDDALQAAIGFLLSEKEATLARLKHAIESDLLWLLPRDQKTVITVIEGKLDIDFRPLAIVAGQET